MFLVPYEDLTPTFIADLRLARDALAYARELHRGQHRDSDQAPFILHPLEVAALLHNSGHPEHVVAAGILHDTLEDTDADPENIARRFGPQVAELVRAMTENPQIEPFQDRKAMLRQQIAEFDGDAIAIFAADKVAKVRELRAHASRDPSLLADDRRSRPRLDHYLESLAMLEQTAADHPLVRQLRFELEALHALPPQTGPPAP